MPVRAAPSRADLTRLLDDLQAVLDDDGPKPPGWRWVVHQLLVIVAAARDYKPVAAGDVRDLIAAGREAAEWRVQHLGSDRNAELRSRCMPVLEWLAATLPEASAPAAGRWPRPSVRDRIRARRCEVGLTQRELAEKVDPRVTEMTVRRWEHGRARPSLAHGISLAAVLGGRPDDYLEDSR